MGNNEIKTKHHHVWAHYLKQWSLNNRDVWHTTKGNNIALNSVKGLAQRKHFYKISRLLQQDVIFIKRFISSFSAELQEIHESFLNSCIGWSLAKQSSDHSMFPSELNDPIEKFENNILEDMHTGIENGVRPIFDKLTQGDISILNNNENMIKFFKLFWPPNFSH